MPEIPAVVLEFIDGRTLDTPDLARDDYIPRIGRAVRDLHRQAPPMANTMVIWKFLEDYLALIGKHALACPDGILDWLPTVRRIEAALAVNALPLVPSNNDLLAKNIMDDGRIRIIDYDFSGMNDPMFDVGDLAMEGDYGPGVEIPGRLHRLFRRPRPGSSSPGLRCSASPPSTPGRCCSSAWTRCSATPRPRTSTIGRRPRRAGTGPGPSWRIRRWRP